MAGEARVAVFDTEERAQRAVRWLERSGMRPRIQPTGDRYAVVVPAGRAEHQAREVLAALERTRNRAEPPPPTGWDWVRSRIFNVESLGTLVFVVFGGILLLVLGIVMWAWVNEAGLVLVGVVLVAGLVYFAASGWHSAVRSPRPSSGKHDTTQQEDEIVRYRHAWLRDQFGKSRRGRGRRGRADDSDA